MGERFCMDIHTTTEIIRVRQLEKAEVWDFKDFFNSKNGLYTFQTDTPMIGRKEVNICKASVSYFTVTLEQPEQEEGVEE